MPDIPITFQRGRKTSGDVLAFPEGFVGRMENAVFHPEDADRPHKIPGRTVAAALPSAATTANTRDIAFGQYDNGNDQLFLLANSQLYETPATSPGTWTSVTDQQTPTPVAFARAGSFLKVIADGQDRYIAWTGAPSERPLVRDEDGNWRYLTLKKPVGKLTLQPVVSASAPTIVRPSADETPATTSEGTTTFPFDNESSAYDTSATTFAQKQLTTVGQIVASDFKTFNAVGASSNHKVRITLETSSGTSSQTAGSFPRSRYGTWRYGTASAASEPLNFNVTVQVSENNGSTYTTVYTAQAPIPLSTIEYTLANTTLAWDQLRVRVIGEYVAGTAACAVYLYDIKAGNSTATSGGGDNIVADGTYYYATTEVYQVTTSSGRVHYVESAPSDVASVAIPPNEGDVVRGVILTLPTASNGLADGVEHDVATKRLHMRNIYRSTTTGTWPDLGFVGQLAASETTFNDIFEVSGTTLGSPGMPVVFVGDATFPLGAQAPAFLDATIHKGAIIAIPADDTHQIVWSPPGNPEAWPLPQAFPFLPSERGDEVRGLASVGDSVVIWTRTRTVRVREFPMATSVNFDASKLLVAVISGDQGLAGSPRGHCLFQSQSGYPVAAWISDSGIWMTDGSLPSERGLGATRLSFNLDWRNDVDTTRLEEARLIYDPIVQALFFDYYDPDGILQCVWLHTSNIHWTQIEGQTVPKISGPHTLRAYGRAVGEVAGSILHWVLDTPQLRILNERTGEDNATRSILSHVETEWVYPGSARNEMQLYAAALYHTDWGPHEQAHVELWVRHDETGHVTMIVKPGLSLAGARTTALGLLEGAGQAFRLILRHTGKTTSFGKPIRAFGPLMLNVEILDEVRKD